MHPHDKMELEEVAERLRKHIIDHVMSDQQLDNTYNGNILTQVRPSATPCPHCGYCPACGRTGPIVTSPHFAIHDPTFCK